MKENKSFEKSIQFIFRNDKERIIQRLEYYGIKKLPYLLTLSGKEKIRGYTGSLTTDEIMKLNNEIGFELIGLYLFHDYHDELRLSFDAINALKDQITKNIIEISDKHAEDFLKGRDVSLNKEEFEKLKDKKEEFGFKVIKNKEEFIGMGKLTQEGRIVNYMPKERRLR